MIVPQVISAGVSRPRFPSSCRYCWTAMHPRILRYAYRRREVAVDLPVTSTAGIIALSFSVNLTIPSESARPDESPLRKLAGLIR